jgi:1-acyl-sn-glycerol-3-phosphate acyltransferase
MRAPMMSWFGAPRGVKFIYGCVYVTTRFVTKLYFRCSREGLDRMPKDGPLIVVANHVSYLDPMIVGSSLPREFHFLAKEELFQGRILGWLLPRLNTRPIRRGAGTVQAIRDCEDALAKGHAVIIFPEGTRSTDGQLQEAKGGAAMIAERTGATILPIYLDGTFRAWPAGAAYPRPARIRIIIGDPFSPSEFADEQDRKLRQQKMSERMMAEIAKLIPQT